MFFTILSFQLVRSTNANAQLPKASLFFLFFFLFVRRKRPKLGSENYINKVESTNLWLLLLLLLGSWRTFNDTNAIIIRRGVEQSTHALTLTLRRRRRRRRVQQQEEEEANHALLLLLLLVIPSIIFTRQAIFSLLHHQQQQKQAQHSTALVLVQSWFMIAFNINNRLFE